MFLFHLKQQSITFALLLALALGGCSQGSSDSTPARQLPANGTDSIADVVARTGPIVTVRTGEMVTFDGSKSYSSSSSPLSYQWTLLSQPTGSTAAFQDAGAESPSFMADIQGTYVAGLVVSAEGINSRRAISLATASTPRNNPAFMMGCLLTVQTATKAMSKVFQ